MYIPRQSKTGLCHWQRLLYIDMHQYWYARIKQLHYFLGLLIGVGLVLAHLAMTLPQLSAHLDGNQYLFTPYTQWISFNTDPWTIALFLSLPLLSTLSAAQIIGEDARSGFIAHIVQYRRLKHYLLTNLGVSFIGGALTIIVPLLIDFIGMWCFLPHIKPDQILNANMSLLPDTTYFASLYYTHPLALVGFYVLLAGAVAGMFGLLGAVVSLFVDNRFIGLGFGFTLTMMLNVLSNALPHMAFSPVLLCIGCSPAYIPTFSATIAGFVVAIGGLSMLGSIAGRRRVYV